MKLPLQDLFAFAASDAFSAPKRATRAPLASWRRSSATNFCVATRTNNKTSQVSCSLTAEAGRISRGSSAPQRRPRLFFSYRTVSSSPSRNLRHVKFQAGMCAQEQQSVREVTSSRPCPSEQEISTTLLGEDE